MIYHNIISKNAFPKINDTFIYLILFSERGHFNAFVEAFKFSVGTMYIDNVRGTQNVLYLNYPYLLNIIQYSMNTMLMECIDVFFKYFVNYPKKNRLLQLLK